MSAIWETCSRAMRFACSADLLLRSSRSNCRNLHEKVHLRLIIYSAFLPKRKREQEIAPTFSKLYPNFESRTSPPRQLYQRQSLHENLRFGFSSQQVCVSREANYLRECFSLGALSLFLKVLRETFADLQCIYRRRYSKISIASTLYKTEGQLWGEVHHLGHPDMPRKYFLHI